MQYKAHNSIPPIMPPYTKPDEPSVPSGFLTNESHSTMQNKTLAQANPPITDIVVRLKSSSASIPFFFARYVPAMKASTIPIPIISP